MSAFYPVTHHLEDEDTRDAECNNCGEVRKIKDLNIVKDAQERLHAGEEVPAGECPDCYALCYLVPAKAASEKTAKAAQ